MMPKMTGMDYAQYRYDLLSHLYGCSPTHEQVSSCLEERGDDVMFGVFGYILGVGLFSSEDITEYTHTPSDGSIHEIYQNKYWDEIDRG